MVVTIKKDGSFKNEHTEELYKCCKYKSAKDFVKLHQWDDYELWGKRKGKAGNENKCELPELNEIFLVHYVFVKKTPIYLWMNG